MFNNLLVCSHGFKLFAGQLSRIIRNVFLFILFLFLIILFFNAFLDSRPNDNNDMPYFMQQIIQVENQIPKSNPDKISNLISSQSEPNLSNTTKLHARIYKRDIAMTDYINIPQFPYLDNFKNPCFKVYANETSDKFETKCMPYFMIGGFPKTGTTDLYKRMIRHPHINGPAKGKHFSFF